MTATPEIRPMRQIPMRRAVTVLAGSAVVLLTACETDLTGLNANPNNPVDAPAGPLFSNAVRNTVDRFHGAGFELSHVSLFAQHIAQVQYTDEDRYRLRLESVNSFFEQPYVSELEDLEKVIDKATAADAPNTAGPAIVLQQWIYQQMTDLWGDIPYSEALQGDKQGSLKPVYDPQKDIYYGMLASLTSASSSMLPAGGDAGLGAADPIYGGDVGQWRRFANSLRARLAMRLVKADPGKADTELRAAFAAAGGVMTSNADNAQLEWPGDGVYDNPWASNFGGRDDHRVSKTLVDTMLALSDPRLPVYAQPTADDPSVYAGLQNGLTNTDAGAQFTAVSRPGAIFYPGSTVYGTFGTSAGNRTPSYLMVYAELAFVRAEAAARGIGGLTAGQAQGFYEDGVRASILQWGRSDAQATAYLAQPGVAYSGGAAGLAQIGLQKWIALYTQGLEAWSEWRRTGNPATIRPGPAASLPQHVRRLPYPTSEQAVNMASLTEAIARQGPDNMLTRVWWDKP